MTAGWPLLLAAALAAVALLPTALRGQRDGAPPRVAGGLALLGVELPDGPVWTLGAAGVARPFRVRIRLANVGAAPLRLWDPGNSEGRRAPGVVLAGAGGGQPVVLRPPPFERSGVPTTWTIAPGEVRAIELDLLTLVDGAVPAPGAYTLRAVYENALPAVGGMGGVWTGRLGSRPLAITIARPAPGAP